MGTLKPGATYIYERADGIVYAREFGADPRDRFVVGYESGKDYDTVQALDGIKEDKMWSEIRLAAKTNLALQEALERVKVIYELSKDE
jgi:hypothetical protein